MIYQWMMTFTIVIGVMLLGYFTHGYARQKCKTPQKWYKGKCRSSDEIEKLKLAGDKKLEKRQGKEDKKKKEEEKWEQFYPTVFIQGECFNMGCIPSDTGCESDEKPSHRVCLGAFHLGKTEVTVAQFETFVKETKYETNAEKKGGCFVWEGEEWVQKSNASWRNPGYTQADTHPVVCVSWNDAMAFAAWLSQKTGKSWRLPTEAEWEYAAKSRGQNIKYPWGDSQASCQNAVMNDGAKGCGKNGPWPVCSKPEGNTAEGLCDMAGNAWEWCSDWFDVSYYASSPETGPKGPKKGQSRVLRGGSWLNAAEELRMSYRERAQPASWYTHYGFRLVLEAK